MQIQRMPLSALKPAPYNPRLKLKPGDAAWKKLERSLDEFDLVQPIVWNQRTGHVVGGHQRVTVLQHRGETEVDCVIVDLSLEKEKALNVTLNNASVASDWDADKLIDLVQELQELPDFDATLTGFDEQQLRDLVLAPALPSESDGDVDAGTADDGMISLSMQVPADRFSAVELWLDELLAAEPGVRFHFRRTGESDDRA